MTTVEELLRTGPVLSEASIFERLRREPGIAFDAEVGIGGLVTDDRGFAALSEIHRGYLRIGLDAGLPVLLQTDTWRAHPLRVARSGFAGMDLNAQNARMLRDLRTTEAGPGDRVVIGGLVGPLGDGYGGDVAPSAEVAEAEMRDQVESLETAGVDLLIAGTLPNGAEALGIARALAASTLPYLIGVVVRPDGTLANGQLFIDISKEPGPGITDGLRVDTKGNLYETAPPGGIWINRKSTRLNSSHVSEFRMPSSA